MILVITVSMLLLVAVLVAASLLPYFLFRSSRRKHTNGSSIYILSMCNCFACGIFMATCLLALIPHARLSEKLLHDQLFGAPNASTQQHDNSPSFMERLIDTQLMILLGFLGILLTEQSVLLCLPAPPNGDGHAPLRPDGNSAHSRQSSSSKGRLRLKKAAHFTNSSSNSDSRDKSSSLPTRESEPLVVLLKEADADAGSHDTSPLNYISSTASSCSDEEDEFGALHFRSPNPADPTSSHHHNPNKATHKASGGVHQHGFVPSNGSGAQIGLLLLAMSAHSVFEGIALGAMDDTAHFLRLLFTIVLHEVLCSFAYGVNLSGQGSSTRLAVFSSIFLACSIPFGMVVMAWVGTLKDGTLTLLLRFILEGLSCGIFIYVSCVEMLAQEFHGHSTPAGAPKRHGLLKALTVVGGAGTAFFINVLFNGH